MTMMLNRQWKDYWNSYGTNPISKLMNVWVFVTLLLILVIGLSGFSLKTGNYAKILENNVSSLQSQFNECINREKQAGSDLDTCSLNLQAKVNLLTTCQSDKVKVNDNYNECKSDLSSYQSNYADIQSKYDSARDDYDHCSSSLTTANSDKSSLQTSLNNLQSNFDQLKSNYLNDYLTGYCCVSMKNTTTSKTYYVFANNDLTCSKGATSGSIEFSC